MLAWCSSQCARANACLCLFVQGLGFFVFTRPTLFLIFGFACGRKKPSWISRSLYFAASVISLGLAAVDVGVTVGIGVGVGVTIGFRRWLERVALDVRAF